VAAIALVAAGLKGVHLLARSRTVQLFGTLVARVDTEERVVALTFDDGPTEAAIDEVLSALAARGVRATFFVNGVHLAEAPRLADRLVAAGHELGNHTYAHERMVLRSPSFVRSEVERTDELIRAAGHRGEIYFRPPFCWKLVGLPWYLSRNGRTTVTWDVDADAPPHGSDASRIVSEVTARVRPGSIVLMHVWYSSRAPSRAALPLIVDRLLADGYRFVTVGELLALRRRTVYGGCPVASQGDRCSPKNGRSGVRSGSTGPSAPYAGAESQAPPGKSSGAVGAPHRRHPRIL
jgi:peptidoglycan/xylan/chitin deacetylase (PgdA/CDA1 family)